MNSEQLIIISLSFAVTIHSGYLIIFIIGFFIPGKHYSSETPKVSVIIAVRNEEQKIERCINSICNQTYSNKLFEVIIVNDQSDDATEEIVKSLQKKYNNLKVINIAERPQNYAPKKYAINEALKIADGAIILTTDADITVKPTWVESIVSFFEKDIGLVVGFSSVRENQTKKIFQKFEALDFLMLMTATKGSVRIGIPVSCSGQNLSFRRKAFNDVGGFGAQDKTQSADDVLLLHLMRKSKKWKIVFADDPNAFVETDATASITGLLKQRIRWAAMGVSQFTKSLNLAVVSIATAVVNIGLLLLLTGYFLFSAELQKFIMMAFFIKFIFELFIAVLGRVYFNKSQLLRYFPVLFVLYMPYILVISLFSLFGNFKWKDRVYIKGNVKDE